MRPSSKFRNSALKQSQRRKTLGISVRYPCARNFVMGVFNELKAVYFLIPARNSGCNNEIESFVGCHDPHFRQVRLV